MEVEVWKLHTKKKIVKEKKKFEEGKSFIFIAGGFVIYVVYGTI